MQERHVKPLKMILQAGVFGSLCTLGVAVSAFILWSLACIGSAVVDFLTGGT